MECHAGARPHEGVAPKGVGVEPAGHELPGGARAPRRQGAPPGPAPSGAKAAPESLRLTELVGDAG
jgi:hypothetical protein